MVLDEEEEKEIEALEVIKHETAVITPELIEKSKALRMRAEEEKKIEITTEDTEEEDWDDFSEDIISNIRHQIEQVSDDKSASFGEFETKKEPEV